MRTFVAILSAMLLPRVCCAAPMEKFYYVGEAKLTVPSGKVYGSQVSLQEKTLDPDNSLFVE